MRSACRIQTVFADQSPVGTGRMLGFLRDTLAPLIDGKVDLGSANQALVDQFLKGAGIDVYVDDIDRGWEGRKEDIQRISALINAMRDLSTDNKGLRFKLSLRSDVYFLVRTSDESTDKIEGSVVWCSWSNHEIFVLSCQAYRDVLSPLC